MRALAIAALATSALGAGSALASESAVAETPEASRQWAPETPAWRGVFCTTRSGSRWNSVAYAAVVVAIGWLARRDSIASS